MTFLISKLGAMMVLTKVERSIYNQVTLSTEALHNLLSSWSEKVHWNTKNSKKSNKNHGFIISANAAKAGPKKSRRDKIKKRPRIRRRKRIWEPKEPVEKGKRKTPRKERRHSERQVHRNSEWRRRKRRSTHFAFEHMVNDEVPVLRGDIIGDIPSHLSLLMKLGDKFVAFPNPRHFFSNMSRKYIHGFLELRRVLVWHVYHQKHPSSKQSHYRLFESFPYKRMYVRKGTSPPPCVEQTILHEVS